MGVKSVVGRGRINSSSDGMRVLTSDMIFSLFIYSTFIYLIYIYVCAFAFVCFYLLQLDLGSAVTLSQVG